MGSIHLNPPSASPRDPIAPETWQEVEYRAPRCKMVSDVDVEEKTWRESCSAKVGKVMGLLVDATRKL
jgi:hypothetical protein